MPTGSTAHGAASSPPSPPPPASSAAGGRRRVIDPFSEVKGRVHQALIDSLGPRLYDPHLPEAELAAQVRQTLQETIDAEQTPLSHADRTRIAQEVSDEILGHGPLEPLLRDPEITEIMVNGPDYVFVERSGKIYPVDARFTNEAHLRRVIDKIVGRVGRRIDEASPLVDARLPDGSRVNAVIAPVALDGAMLTIRKFSQDPFTDADLIAFGTISPAVRDFLKACVLGPPEHRHLRRYRLGQDDHAQRHLVVHPRGRAHRHHRGRRRAPAAPGARAAAGVAPGEHRGSRPDRDPRPGEELAAYAPRPHRRR